MPNDSSDHFVINTHTDPPTRTFSNRKLNHLTHFLVGTVTLTRSSLGNFRTYFVSPPPSCSSEREDLDPVGRGGREPIVITKTKTPET